MEFLFPPRPLSKILPARLPQYAKAPWLAQPKYNGTRNLIHVYPDGTVKAWMRQGEPHKQWEMSDEIKEQILSLELEKGQEYWFDSELLHNKTTTKHYKNRIVLFDVLWAGRYLFKRPSLQGRYDLLCRICGNPTKRETQNGIAISVSKNLWLAPMIQPADFQQAYNEFLHLDEIEGLVLKKANSSLDNFGRKYYEVGWQLRCRKPHKNYTF